MANGEPLCILDVSQPDWKINVRTFNSVLRKVRDRPIAIYSICGSTRGGKSYLLNYFVRYLASISNLQNEVPKEFKWQNGGTRVTTGIDLWSEPFFVQTDQEEVAVLLMDTQGLFDQETSYRQNAILFTFSCLFSSVMMFNQSKLVTEEVLQNIERFTTYANDIAYQSGNRNSPSVYFNSDIPTKLLFILRDFDPPEYEHGLHNEQEKPVGSERNFFGDLFNNEKGVNYPLENLETRKRILQIYPVVEAFLLPHPGKAFVRPGPNTINPDDDFVHYAETLVKLVLSEGNLVKKIIRGQVVSGKQYKHTVERVAKICENPSQYFADVQNVKGFDDHIYLMRAVNTALDYYEQNFSQFLESSPDRTFDAELQKSYEAAISGANEKFQILAANFQSPQRDEYQTILQEWAHMKFIEMERRADIERMEMERRAYVEAIEMEQRACAKQNSKSFFIGVGVTLFAVASTAAIVGTGGAGAGVVKASIAAAGATVAAVTTGATAATIGAAAGGGIAVGAAVGAGAVSSSKLTKNQKKTKGE